VTVPVGSGQSNLTYDDADTNYFVYGGTWGVGAAASQVSELEEQTRRVEWAKRRERRELTSSGSLRVGNLSSNDDVYSAEVCYGYCHFHW